MNAPIVKRKVSIDIISSPHFAEPCLEYRRNHPQMFYNARIYLNDYRIGGGKDYGGDIIHTRTIDVVNVLKALNIPDNIINQINFEDGHSDN